MIGYHWGAPLEPIVLPQGGPLGGVLTVLPGFSIGGTVLLSALAASAPYAAAPAVMRGVVPEADSASVLPPRRV